MIKSTIPITIITSQKQVNTDVKCTITKDLEIFISPSLSNQEQNHTLNVTYDTYHDLNGVPIRVETPLLNAIKYIIKENYYITHVAPMSDNLIAITEGLIFKDTHIYRMENGKLSKVV
jgi:hypothetical protein